MRPPSPALTGNGRTIAPPVGGAMSSAPPTDVLTVEEFRALKLRFHTAPLQRRNANDAAFVTLQVLLDSVSWRDVNLAWDKEIADAVQILREELLRWQREDEEA